jgi:hypothetical protein
MFQEQIQNEKMSSGASNSCLERVQFDEKDISTITTSEGSIEAGSCLLDWSLEAHWAKIKMIQGHNMSSGAGGWQPESGKKFLIKPFSFRDLFLVTDSLRTVGHPCSSLWHY